jgi:cold shock CspA family protein
MAKSKETSNKKEKEKRRLKQKQDKQEKMEERKLNAKKGKSLDEMMAYIDENGNLTDTPPDPRNKKIFRAEDISLTIEPTERSESFHAGVVSFFDEKKGFGFINDSKTNDRIFVHANDLHEPIAASDKVTFDLQRGNRGLMAIHVKKISS